MAGTIIDRFKQFSQKPSIIWNGKTYNYKWLLENIDIWERTFEDQGISDKKIVAIKSEYLPKAIALFLALMKNKFIIVPVSLNDSEEVKNKITIAEVEAIVKFDRDESYTIEFTGNKFTHPFIKSLVNKDKSGLVLFSSGSTGKPKAMIHDLNTLAGVYSEKKPRDLKTLVFLMFDHIGGINTLFNILSTGGTAVFPSGRTPEEICELIEKYKVHLLPTSPTFLNLVLISGVYKRFNLSSLKLITYGTEPMPESLLKRLRVIFPKVKFLQTFGTSETGIATTQSRSSGDLYMKLNDRNFEHKIVDGELWIKSKTQILGYLNQESPFAEGGWFPTGDLVEVTDDNYLKIIGRKKEIINVGGQKVLPLEVESVLLEMKEVGDAVVYGRPNPLMGEIVAAKVVLKEKLIKDEIIKKIKRYCKQKLATYKIPVKIDIVNNLKYGTSLKKKRLI